MLTTKKSIKSCFYILLISLLSLNQTFSQENFEVKGILRDGLSEQYLRGAILTIRETAYSAISKEDGSFLLSNVRGDRYVLNINIAGYQSYQSQINVKNSLDLGEIRLFPLGYENPDDMALQKTIRATNIAELFSKRPNFIGGNQVFGIPPEPKRLIGNYYLDPKWNKASILLYRDNEVMEGYFVRYNISSNNFEIRDEVSDLVTVLPGLRVQNIVWIDSEHNVPRFFINGMDFKDEGSPIAGFFEVLVDGKKPLVRRTIATVKASNYNTALMVGERDDKIVKRNSYYFLDERQIIPVPKQKKRFYKIFEDEADEIESFVKENSVNIKQPSGYFTVFTFYNSKFEGFEPLVPKLVDN
jgi:hypothetical protein